ncbi:hypothetical protein SAMN05192533_105200 [Mesobacillus persicus]|uniref:Uncharacterized protein n=1 Tax=Mesobacillus persicus TaxID=930146 RepID=A0A1H8AXL3_9BACI|nr:hypothetical protein SAMN05192533_105200 [Mesobacillus persicus]
MDMWTLLFPTSVTGVIIFIVGFLLTIYLHLKVYKL